MMQTVGPGRAGYLARDSGRAWKGGEVTTREPLDFSSASLRFSLFLFVRGFCVSRLIIALPPHLFSCFIIVMRAVELSSPCVALSPPSQLWWGCQLRVRPDRVASDWDRKTEFSG